MDNEKGSITGAVFVDLSAALFQIRKDVRLVKLIQNMLASKRSSSRRYKNGLQSLTQNAELFMVASNQSEWTTYIYNVALLHRCEGQPPQDCCWTLQKPGVEVRYNREGIVECNIN